MKKARAASATSQTAIPKEKIVELYRRAVQSNIPLELVEDKVANYLMRARTAEDVEDRVDDQSRRLARKHTSLRKRVFFTLTPLICIFVGVFLLGNAIYPIVTSYFFTDATQETAMMANMPKIVVEAQTETTGTNVLGANTTATTGATTPTPTLSPDYVPPTILNDELDYTNLSNWFPSLSMPQVDENNTTQYILDVPSQDIHNATVKLGGSNLDKSLIQYPGTALPGQPGEPVIFGHSILPQFYNPSESNPRRYISIFSKLSTMKSGDLIYITHDNIRYTYQVQKKSIVKPEDTFILEQSYNTRGLRLVTCHPPGTTYLRLVVDAVLVQGK